MGFDDVCNTGLVLGLGLGLSFSLTQECNSSPPSSKQALDLNNIEKPKKSNSSNFDEPSLTLSLSGHEPTYQEEPNFDLYHQSSVSPHDSAVSSFSSGRVKRERDRSDEEAEVEKVNDSSRASSDEDHEDGHGPSARKKLRLTKDQSALLEDSFKQNTTLNPKQKQALARKLNLRPRQVEVWFQNRRARKKLKKTEVDCELLKKCYETLTDENKRLQKELQELKALKFSSQPFYMHMPARMCPSCEIIGGGVGNNIASKSPFSMAPKSHFFNSFNNPSAAC